ncbi:hypothetical protein AAC387_Pa02g1343 [Persea americana]
MLRTSENQMDSSCSPPSPSCVLKHSSISLAVSLLLLYVLLVSILSPTFLTFSVLIFSTALIFTFTKKKHIFKENSIEDEVVISRGCNSSLEKEVDREIEPEFEVVSPENTVVKDGDMGQINECEFRSPALLSESDSIDLSSTSEDSEVGWPLPYNKDQIRSCSDCSISDDESLIEIELRPQEPKGIFRMSEAEFSPESVFRQHGLMELFSEINEINEEDNLIEIDISVGSIKCSRLEIEA